MQWFGLKVSVRPEIGLYCVCFLHHSMYTASTTDYVHAYKCIYLPTWIICMHAYTDTCTHDSPRAHTVCIVCESCPYFVYTVQYDIAIHALGITWTWLTHDTPRCVSYICSGWRVLYTARCAWHYIVLCWNTLFVLLSWSRLLHNGGRYFRLVWYARSYHEVMVDIPTIDMYVPVSNDITVCGSMTIMLYRVVLHCITSYCTLSAKTCL